MLKKRESIKEKENRKIYINLDMPLHERGPTGASKKSYPNNAVKTAKYNLFNFIPKNLFEQFRRISISAYNFINISASEILSIMRRTPVANVYFVFTVVLQFFPQLGAAEPLIAAIPIIFILTVTLIKDTFEDLRRHTADNQLNKSIAWTLSNWENTNYPQPHTPWWKYIFCCFLASKTTNNRVIKKTHLCHCIKAKNDAERGICLNCGLEMKTKFFVFNNKRRRNARRKSGLSLKVTMRGWVQTFWRDIKVGDFIILRNNENVPADILIISTSEPGGLCYAETKNLDGETNLKARESLKETMHVRNANDCKNLRMQVQLDPPDANLYAHHGAVTFSRGDSSEMSVDVDDVVPFSIQNMALRGSIIRNSEYVIGLVVFTGKDTKVLMNSGATPSKRSRLEILMNPMIMLNFGILFAMCAAGSIIESLNSGTWTIQRPQYAPDMNDPWLTGLINFWSSFILYQNIVPISLYITVEGIKTLQAYFINNDVKMYDEETGERCVPKTWNISDDLGQIEYIFSDKTGTLTQNKMEFRKCSINGKVYGKGYTDVSRSNNNDGLTPEQKAYQEKRIENIMRARLSALYDNPHISKLPLTFLDDGIIDDLVGQKIQSDAIKDFFLHLATCHTVLPPKEYDVNKGDELVYNAQSPDEQALVKTAKDMGFTFVERLQDDMILNVLGTDKTVKILNIIEFNSTRKRMSIIVRLDDGRIVLYCKGADSVIMERLAPGEEVMVRQTLSHLEQFANEGLRTLCLAQKEITETEYYEWSKKYHVAGMAKDRDEQLSQVAELIENNLILLGATAIEDKLQDQVPDCIATLRKAGLKIWVLTGDKMETAINIGFASNLLSKDMQLICLNGNDKDNIHKQIREFVGYESGIINLNFSNGNRKNGSSSQLQLERQFTRNSEMKQALIVEGQTLRLILKEDGPLKTDFLLLGASCKSVICCRVSPKQKAQVVRLVQGGLNVMCLAIGDGANDVSMIQAAHVGVGISGQEGLQAAMSSDYVISQFKFLSRLLLVHGHWSYYRISETVFSFLYKDMVWVFLLFWYQFYCGFTAGLIYDYTFVIFYNLVFTSLPPVVLGLFDQDVSQRFLEAFPPLYKQGIQQTLFSYKRYAFLAIDALYQSAACFFFAKFMFSDAVSGTGQDISKDQVGTAIGIFSILAVNVSLGLKVTNWTWIVFAIMMFSLTGVLIFVPLWSFHKSSDLYGLVKKLYPNLTFWLSVIAIVLICVLPRIFYGYIQATFFPSDINIIQERRYMRMPIQTTTEEEENEEFIAAANMAPVIKMKKTRPVSAPSVLALVSDRRPTLIDLKLRQARDLNGFAFSYDEGQASGLGIEVATGVKTTFARDDSSSSDEDAFSDDESNSSNCSVSGLPNHHRSSFQRRISGGKGKRPLSDIYLGGSRKY